MSKNIDETEEKPNPIWLIAGLVAIAFAILTPIMIVIITGSSFSVAELASLGAVGDFFGGSTIGFLSIASIFFIIYTISIQSKELSLQRKELRLTTDELASTRAVHEESNKTMVIQRFETTFFNLLSMQVDLVNSLKFSSDRALSGREVINLMRNRLENLSRRSPHEVSEEIKKVEKLEDKLILLFDFYFKQNGQYIAPYLGNLVSLVTLIDKSNLEIKEKLMYVSILKNVMSKSELTIAFYYFVFLKNPQLIETINRLKLLDNLEPEELLHEEHYKLIFK